MPLRRLDKIALAVSVAAGAALSPGAIAGEPARMLVTFLGLVSASILPSVTLLVNSVTASGRSVAEIQKLDAEVQAAMDALFLMFGAVAIAIAALLFLSIELPTFVKAIPYLGAYDALPRLGQAIVAGATSLIVTRAGQLPAILRHSLAVRREVAIEEARRKLAEKAPDGSAVRQSFSTAPDFGKVVSIRDVQNRDG